MSDANANAFPPFHQQIKEHHVDSLGHLNNATYLALYEAARWEGITANGYGFKEVQAHQKGPVILEVTVKFLRELKLREHITITTEMLDYSGKIGHLKQQMIKEDGEVASEAVFTMAFFDLKERRLIAPTAEWLKAVGLTKPDA